MKIKKKVFSRLIWFFLLGVITHQVMFKWIPLWKNATRLKGTNVSHLLIKNERGHLVPLSEFRGDVLIINFWASWCVPCRIEIPLLNAAYARLLNQNKQLIGVNQNETFEEIRVFQEQTKMIFPVYQGTGDLAEALNIQVIPAIAVIDKNGMVISVTYGFKPWVQAYLLWWV